VSTIGVPSTKMHTENPAMRLTIDDHDRDSAGMTYVYPVVSRRARGLSIGINLNPNKACNWRCIYCQVPGLIRGAPPAADLDVLESELDRLLKHVMHGDFFERHVPEDSRRLNDVALSGDGESTLCPNFEEAVERVGSVLQRYELVGQIPIVLITNGSRMLSAEVERGVRRMATLGGELWFKIDRAGSEDRLRINDMRSNEEGLLGRLAAAARACSTRIQTCVFALDGEAPSEREQQEYLDLLQDAIAEGTQVRDVLLYGLARPPMQPEADRLERLPAEWLEAFADRIRAIGLEVQVHP
jgi:wyosine [tRNA(Phe)-imidazoG37] synthetase (radical SAM superfamily)